MDKNPYIDNELMSELLSEFNPERNPDFLMTWDKPEAEKKNDNDANIEPVDDDNDVNVGDSVVTNGDDVKIDEPVIADRDVDVVDNDNGDPSDIIKLDGEAILHICKDADDLKHDQYSNEFVYVCITLSYITLATIFTNKSLKL